MKPANYQSMASSVINPNISLGHLLSTPNVMRCEKCRFATTDISTFKKHVAQEHTEYYCFYCNRVSLSEAELQTHLQIHTGTSPFKCPHCGQVYMRRMCLIKHIERLHSKIIPQEPPQIAPRVSVSSASQSVSSTASTAPQRPVVRVNVPAPTTAGVTLENNLQRLKSLSSYISNANHGDAVPLNGQVQRNRALTVSLPEEVSIPAGCMVEVAEVKTVDGTKELRLRFVAHQENESVIKNGRTTVPETSKVLSSQIKYPNAASESGMRFGNKNIETKIVNKGRSTLIPVNVSKSFPKQTIKERSNAKRPSEVIDLNAGVPSKISRSFISVGEAKVASQKEPINHTIPPTAMPSMLVNRLTSGSLLPDNLSTLITLKGIEERKSSAPGPPPSSEPLMMNNVQIMPRIVPVNRGPATVKAKEDPILQKNKHDLTNPQQQNLKTLLLPLTPSMVAPTPPQIRATNECKDNLVPKTFTPEQASSQKASPELLAAKKRTNNSNTNMKIPALPQEVKTEKTITEDVRVEREGFPVIYSVYSLSQQQSDPQESTQPIVMAEWTNSAGCDSPKIKSVRTELSEMTGHQAHDDSEDCKITCDTLSSKISCESVKIEVDQDIKDETGALVTCQNIHLKKEKSTPAKANKKCKMTLKVNKTNPPAINANISKTCSPPEHAKVSKPCAPPKHIEGNKPCAPSPQPVNCGPLVPQPPLVAEDLSVQTPVEATSVPESPSKILTVSLKRVRVGIFRKSKKRKNKTVPKLSFAKVLDGPRACTALQLMPLRRDQVVKQPSGNQPVVVLNHPKPCVHMKAVPTKTLRNKEATVTPKCQILKIKLGKVMGQKYEVMGCTVRNFS
ncbi:zinc finger protein 518B [Periophthalmus magnuspinnatus]|uniref:zinc finger protein 518B n=1 Tax=Periophthalmus magnuspinnatus TaxID=409849 RepID=UPI0024370BA1|nr:zinc finger protein 518B [Periophthalmus magnuspinnatus]